MSWCEECLSTLTHTHSLSLKLTLINSKSIQSTCHLSSLTEYVRAGIFSFAMPGGNSAVWASEDVVVHNNGASYLGFLSLTNVLVTAPILFYWARACHCFAFHQTDSQSYYSFTILLLFQITLWPSKSDTSVMSVSLWKSCFLQVIPRPDPNIQDCMLYLFAW